MLLRPALRGLRPAEQEGHMVSTATPSAKKMRRYTLVLPDGLFAELEQVAERRHTTVVEVLRRFIKLGLIAERVETSPDSELILREGGVEQRILLL